MSATMSSARPVDDVGSDGAPARVAAVRAFLGVASRVVHVVGNSRLDHGGRATKRRRRSGVVVGARRFVLSVRERALIRRLHRDWGLNRAIVGLRMRVIIGFLASVLRVADMRQRMATDRNRSRERGWERGAKRGRRRVHNRRSAIRVAHWRGEMRKRRGALVLLLGPIRREAVVSVRVVRGDVHRDWDVGCVGVRLRVLDVHSAIGGALQNESGVAFHRCGSKTARVRREKSEGVRTENRSAR